MTVSAVKSHLTKVCEYTMNKPYTHKPNFYVRCS